MKLFFFFFTRNHPDNPLICEFRVTLDIIEVVWSLQHPTELVLLSSGALAWFRMVLLCCPALTRCHCFLTWWTRKRWPQLVDSFSSPCNDNGFQFSPVTLGQAWSNDRNHDCLWKVTWPSNTSLNIRSRQFTLTLYNNNTRIIMR